MLTELLLSATVRRGLACVGRRVAARTPCHGADCVRGVTQGLATMAAGKPLFFLDPFAKRQFDDPAYTGTHIDFDKEAFAQRINELCTSENELSPGYAPFCKHLFVPNFVGAKVATLAITDSNEHLLKSGYKARTAKELPVLSRWFPKELDEVVAHEAKFLDIILYSREQIVAERAAMNDTSPVPDVPWGIISVKAQDEDHETPMQPITAMRNALGTEHGGSGVELDRESYNASVKYWTTHAPIA
eukprot:m.20385 g.20385  ORF g.20385 m.20385 type:complete len:245 (+) comp6157_c0_seq1:61-795(+)